MIDQTKLPSKLEFIEFSDYPQVADAIKNLIVLQILVFFAFLCVF